MEDVLEGVGELIGYENDFSALRMNKAVVIFVTEETFVQHMIEQG